MAKAWVIDLWVKDATVTLPDGTKARLSPSREDLRVIDNLPEHFRASRFGEGKRWKTVWYEDVMGEKRQRSRLFALKRDAEAYKASLEEDIRIGRYVAPEDGEQLFREVAEKWFTSKRRVKDATRGEYRKRLDQYILPKFGARKLESIRRLDIEAWVAELLDGRAPVDFGEEVAVRKDGREHRPLAASTIHGLVVVVFGAVLHYAVGHRWIASTPLRGIEMPQPGERKKVDALTHRDVEVFAKACQAHTGLFRDYVMIHLLTYSAPRINELLALQRKHFVLSKARLRIEQTWSDKESKGRQLGTPKNGESRTVPIPAHVIPLLETHLEGLGPEAFVFTGEGSEVALWDQNWRSRVWAKAAASTGFAEKYEGFSPHALRHSGITFAIAAGADMKIVQEMAGHKTIKETMETYGKLMPDRLEEVRVLMGEHRKRSLEGPAIGVVDAA